MSSNDENADTGSGAETAIGPPADDGTELMAPTEAAPAMMARSAAETPALSAASHSWRSLNAGAP